MAIVKRLLVGGVNSVEVLHCTPLLMFTCDLYNVPGRCVEAYQKLAALLTTILHSEEGSAGLSEAAVHVNSIFGSVVNTAWTDFLRCLVIA